LASLTGEVEWYIVIKGFEWEPLKIFMFKDKKVQVQ